jgi:CrcB protein
VSPDHHEVIDPDVDLHDQAQRAELRHHWDVLAVIGAGGVAGAEARYGIDVAMPRSAGRFPWATLIVNVSGCLVIGMLMVLLLELTSPHRLARPFLGVGILGGYTTFSTFAVEAEQLVQAHRAGMALLYVTATAIGCMLAVWFGTMLAQLAGRAVVDARSRAMTRRGER